MDFINAALRTIDVLFAVLGILFAHFIVFALLGIFFKKSYPKSDKKLRYGIVVSARNEEPVIRGLIESIQKNKYPQEKLQIFVVAHNCTDKTADIARSLGATVYEYNNPSENTKGYAFKYLFSCIDRDYGVSSFAGFFVFDADNILDKDYITHMNDAFQYYDRKSIITSFRNSKNFGSNLISGLYGMYFSIGCRMESRGRTFTGCSTRVQGTGYLFNSEIVKNGWSYVTLTEDWELIADQVLLSHNIRYCDDAMFYDEQPTAVNIMWRQRLRWSKGHLIVFFTRIKDLVKGIFDPKTKNRFSIYDITVNILPSTLWFLVLNVLKIGLKLLKPLLDNSITYKSILLGKYWGEPSWNIISSDGVIIELLKAFVITFITTAVSAVVIFIFERKRIKGVSLKNKVLISLTWPLFILIQLIIDVQAFFYMNLDWKPIPHGDTTSFEQVNSSSDRTLM